MHSSDSIKTRNCRAQLVGANVVNSTAESAGGARRVPQLVGGQLHLQLVSLEQAWRTCTHLRTRRESSLPFLLWASDMCCCNQQGGQRATFSPVWGVRTNALEWFGGATRYGGERAHGMSLRWCNWQRREAKRVEGGEGRNGVDPRAVSKGKPAIRSRALGVVHGDAIQREGQGRKLPVQPQTSRSWRIWSSAASAEGCWARSHTMQSLDSQPTVQCTTEKKRFGRTKVEKTNLPTVCEAASLGWGGACAERQTNKQTNKPTNKQTNKTKQQHD